MSKLQDHRALWCVFFWLLPFFLWAQLPSKRSYTSLAYLKQQLQEQPNLQTQLDAIEIYVANYSPSAAPVIGTIPIVFHLLYSSAEPPLSEEQLDRQLAALNRDFGLEVFPETHPNDPQQIYRQLAVDTDIRFCLAAVNYVPTTTPMWTDLQAIKQISTAWDSSHYLNIWLLRLPDENTGFAQFPGGNAATDGIVLDERFVQALGASDTDFKEGKTLSHLVGNYLGLYPLWGMELCQDDFVADTPIHNAANFGCLRYKHLSTCDGYPLEMTMNLMDNSADSCLYLFTEGQKKRLQAMLSAGGPRSELGQNATLCDD